MKVCTDACLFGAITSEEIMNRGFENGLDIGTGTGLLSIMLAQKNNGLIIDAVEIDGGAYNQAAENFKNCNWNRNLNPVLADFSAYQSEKKYDLIFSNPPFFENDLKSADEKEILAKHSTALGLQTLLLNAQPLLTQKGIMAVLLPYSRSAQFENLCSKAGFFIYKKISLRQSVQHSFFRVIYFLSNERKEMITGEMAIKNEANEYTPEFTRLLKDYYLHL